MALIARFASLALVSACAAFSAAVPAEKPAWAGKGNKHESSAHGEHRRSDDHDRGAPGGPRFDRRHAIVVRDYFGEQLRGGHCPPGLAKKRNGCLPPGQAKKWAIGQPLPRGVVYYELPPALVVELGRPPAGYKYVRVAADILMIAVGTSLVVDAIQDLGRM